MDICPSCLTLRRVARFRKENPERIKTYASYSGSTEAKRRYAQKEGNWYRKVRRATLSRKDIPKIAKIYSEARERSQESEKQYEVDHIVPLKNPLISGLHVSYNLQILTDEENRKKGNTFVPYFC